MRHTHALCTLNSTHVLDFHEKPRQMTIQQICNSLKNNISIVDQALLGEPIVAKRTNVAIFRTRRFAFHANLRITNKQKYAIKQIRVSK